MTSQNDTYVGSAKRRLRWPFLTVNVSGPLWLWLLVALLTAIGVLYVVVGLTLVVADAT